MVFSVLKKNVLILFRWSALFVVFIVSQIILRSVMLNFLNLHNRNSPSTNDYRSYRGIYDDAETVRTDWQVIGYATPNDFFSLSAPSKTEIDLAVQTDSFSGTPESFGVARPCAAYYTPPERLGFPLAFLEFPQLRCNVSGVWLFSAVGFVSSAVFFFILCVSARFVVKIFKKIVCASTI